jgi:putative acetyltransferase
MSLTIAPDDPADPAASALLTASHALMERLFPAESNHFLSIDELKAGNIHFYTARQGATVLGCGALAVQDGYGELKSMFTAPEARGKGVAARILDRLEEKARALGLPVIRLETGDLLHEALRLYARHGFVQRGPFGSYREDPASIFMEKTL